MTKSKLEVKIVNAETGEEVIRDANAEEIAQMEIDADNAATRKQELETKANQRQAILDRLGITAEEAALLLL